MSPIIFQTVAKGKARIRVMVSALHTKEMLNEAYEQITTCYEAILKEQ